VLETEGKTAGKFGPANGAVADKLIEAGNLLARGRLEHSYPHSWRSKAPVIYRSTPSGSSAWTSPCCRARALRETALESIERTAFFPEGGQARIRNMVESRPDWLISRQRAWGTPLAMFVDRDTNEPLQDEAVNARIVEAIRAEGADAWFTRDAREFLGEGYDPEQYEKIEDILDVWFDSGATHAFAVEGRNDSAWPADLYLEGSDQHRGWFQSSLLEACATRGRPPFKAVLTHGFTLDEAGEKMSKSKGNTVAPQTVIKESGAEILRLWTASVDYEDDQRIGKTVLATVSDSYRKLRNTVRYLLGALADFEEAERIGLEAMPPLERFVLHRLWALDGQVRAAYGAYRFSDVTARSPTSAPTSCRPSTSTSARTASTATGPDSDRRRAARHRDGPGVRAADRLALAPALLHHRGGLDHPVPDGGSNCLPHFPETPRPGATTPRRSAGPRSSGCYRWSPPPSRSSVGRSGSAARSTQPRGSMWRTASFWPLSTGSTRRRCSAPARRR
jgi:isoleucyl-tRNA synthetase